MTDPRYSSVPPPAHMAVSPATPTNWQQPTYQLPPSRKRRVPGWIIAVGAATSVLAVVSFFTVLLWPGGGGGQDPSGPLQFQRFGGSLARIEFGQPTRTMLTSVEGGNGYTAYESGGNLRVIAFDVTTGAERWRQDVTGSSQWSRIIATPGALLAFALEEDDTVPRRMYVLDAETGGQRWHVDVRGDDSLFFLDGALGWLDREGRALRGLDLATGGERWRHDFPGEEESHAVAVLGEADQARPSILSGEVAAGVGDHRIVMINPDRSVSVIDGGNGNVISRGSNLANPDDVVLAYGERLFVAPDEVDYQFVSYGLTQLSGLPQVLYAASDPDRYPLTMEPCGTNRMCLLERDQFEEEATDVVAVNAADGGEIWRGRAPEAERLIGVGSWAVTAASLTYEPTVLAFDEAGRTAVESTGLPVRLNDANLMILTTAGGYEEYLEATGVAIDGGAPFEMGRLPEGFDQTQCSWNERFLVCPDRTGTEIWRFAQN